MKKKYLFLLTTVLTSAVFLAGCGSNETSESTEASTETAAKEITGYLIDNAQQYVTLGTYQGMDVEKPIYEVTDDEVSMEVDNILYENAVNQEADRPAETGDILTVDLTAAIEGESEPVLSETDYTIELGYEEFGADFDAQLEGCSVGDKKTFSCSFDEDTWYEDWIGKTLEFEVTVTAIQETIVPEYTDEFVQDTLGYDSKEELEAALLEQLSADYATQSETETKYNALMAAMDASEFEGYPDKLYDSCKASVEEQYDAFAEMYGMTTDELLEAYDMTEDDLEEEILEAVNVRLLISALCQKENLTVTDTDYTDYLTGQYQEYGYEDADSFESEYGKEYIMWALYEDKVSAFLVENSNVYDAPFSLEDDLEDYETEDVEELDGLAEEEQSADEEGSEADTETLSEDGSEGDAEDSMAADNSAAETEDSAVEDVSSAETETESITEA